METSKKIDIKKVLKIDEFSEIVGSYAKTKTMAEKLECKVKEIYQNEEYIKMMKTKKSAYTNEFADWLKININKKRKSSNLKEKELMKELNLGSNNTIYSWKKGKKNISSLDFFRICSIMDVDPISFFEDYFPNNNLLIDANYTFDNIKKWKNENDFENYGLYLSKWLTSRRIELKIPRAPIECLFCNLKRVEENKSAIRLNELLLICAFYNVHPLNFFVHINNKKSDFLQKEYIHKNRKWTTKEIDFISKNHNKLTNDEIAKKLNRSEVAIYAKKGKLGLLEYKQRKELSKEEMQFIENNYKNYTGKVLAKKLGRSKQTVYKFLKSKKLNANANKVINKLSDEESKFIENNHKNYTCKELAEKLGRSKQTVYRFLKIKNLNAKKAFTEFSDEELEYLKRNFGTLSIKKMAEKLGRPYSTVQKKIEELKQL